MEESAFDSTVDIVYAYDRVAVHQHRRQRFIELCGICSVVQGLGGSARRHYSHSVSSKRLSGTSERGIECEDGCAGNSPSAHTREQRRARDSVIPRVLLICCEGELTDKLIENSQ